MNDKIQTLVTQFPEWKHENDQLVAQWKLDSFTELRTVVTQLCDLAEELNHHPDVTYGYDTLRIKTYTHDAGNVVTELDVTFAQRASEIVGR